VRTMFEQPTVARLAATLAATTSAGTPPRLEARPRPKRLALSFAQQRLWFLDQLEPGSALYNIPLPVRLKGDLNMGALQRAVGAIVARHGALRTTFVVEDGEPVQKVHAVRPWPIASVGVERVTPEQLAAEARKPFDLATGPLVRATLLSDREDECVLL